MNQEQFSYAALLQIRSYLNNLITDLGITEERMQQLKIVEKLLSEKAMNEKGQA